MRHIFFLSSICGIVTSSAGLREQVAQLQDETDSSNDTQDYNKINNNIYNVCYYGINPC